MNHSNLRLKTVILIMTLFFGLTAYAFGIPSVPKMFKMNKELQEQGYYMAEFEFKMLGIVYNLDHGHYFKAYTQLTKLNKQLKTKEGLIKTPTFTNKQEEYEFYLNLQNPKTGSFMDETYPFCTYTGPTGNVLIHLEALAKETGQPLKLKYPLTYLDEINTPEKLNKYLNEVSTVGWLGTKFPQTSFHFARDLLSMFYEDNTVERHNLYQMSPEWKNALLSWFYEHQDSETGLWGPKNSKGKLKKKDTMNTGSILKSFIDDEGNNIHIKFPLRYRDQLAKSILKETSFSLPKDDDLDDWHEWNLNTSKSIRMLTRCLWRELSEDSKLKSKELIKHFISTKFSKFYIEKEGAFSYYPCSKHATLDGSGGILTSFKENGAFSGQRFLRMWGNPDAFCKNYGIIRISKLNEQTFKSNMCLSTVNSIRFYILDTDSCNYTDHVLGVFYPKKPIVLDVMDFIPKMTAWIDSTNQSLGNWTSKEDIQESLIAFNIKSTPVFYQTLPLELLNNTLVNNKKLILIGFDELQLPQCKVTYLID